MLVGTTVLKNKDFNLPIGHAGAACERFILASLHCTNDTVQKVWYFNTFPAES